MHGCLHKAEIYPHGLRYLFPSHSWIHGHCSSYPSLSPYTGSMPGIKAFVAAVFGGIGSIPGALVGGILLGVIEILSKYYISSQLSDAIVFGMLIIVLLLKPTGIFGKKIQEKV